MAAFKLHPGKENEAGAETVLKQSKSDQKDSGLPVAQVLRFAAGKRSSHLCSASQNKGGAYTTDDGYVFSPSFISDTGDVYLGFLMLVTFIIFPRGLSAGELALLLQAIGTYLQGEINELLRLIAIWRKN